MQFLVENSPALQMDICKDSSDCYFGNHITLAGLNKEYGEGMAIAWLLPQLHNLSEFCGCSNKLTDKPLEECARLINNEYKFLKITEVMLFLYKYKQGAYGHMYGSVDPMTIMERLKDFVDDRYLIYEQHENEQRKIKLEEDKKKAVTYEEWKKLTHK